MPSEEFDDDVIRALWNSLLLPDQAKLTAGTLISLARGESPKASFRARHAMTTTRHSQGPLSNPSLSPIQSAQSEPHGKGIQHEVGALAEVTDKTNVYHEENKAAEPLGKPEVAADQKADGARWMLVLKDTHTLQNGAGGKVVASSPTAELKHTACDTVKQEKKEMGGPEETDDIPTAAARAWDVQLESQCAREVLLFETVTDV